jgi:hypothetical protein
VASRADTSRGGGEEGTASVELVAVLPFLLIAVLAAAQIALVGQALWAAAVAARSGARASAVGRDARAAARRSLPADLRGGADIEKDEAVTVRVDVPRLFPGVPELPVSAGSKLVGAGG